MSDSIIYKLRDYIAGLATGLTQILIGHPFDTIKVRQQSSVKNLTIKQVLFDLLKNEGTLAIYNGVASPLICTSFLISIQFGVFQNSLKALQDIQNRKELPIYQIALCGSISGAACSPIMAPMENIRIKMQVNRNPYQYTNTLDCFKRTFQQYGIRGIYKGFNSTLIRELPGECIYFLIYEMQMRKLRQSLQQQPLLLQYSPLLAGAVSGLIFWISVFPIDTLKSRIQSDDMQNPLFKNFLDCFKKTVNKEGFGALFKGINVCIIRSLPANGFGFLAFEETKKLIEISYSQAIKIH
ncbi:mitochondrial carrier protein, putative [Ichthyophthirius multifiliis]|uniref:Mitochondrial carrier protein, putative n=1 Tax=Ichthyophthirius multifiliis TaxID=5932 RepID=G0QWZ1_ICHMU|nr:mitochondrial carrier protein, putative [Ichthyophthirius multifiliis]EGR30272.1 mitochondrial carrier protein, putative [Ichthyophthirius multifiliis]|eukprot:XP_004065518.1 mitochondrial carrier protein, putative [Ichthyophthirius multifiliis]